MSTILCHDGVYVSALPLLVSRGSEDSANDEWPLTILPEDYQAPEPYEIGDGYADQAEDYKVVDEFASWQLEQASLACNGRYVAAKVLKARARGFFTPKCLSQEAQTASFLAIAEWRTKSSHHGATVRRWLAEPIKQRPGQIDSYSKCGQTLAKQAETVASRKRIHVRCM